MYDCQVEQSCLDFLANSLKVFEGCKVGVAGSSLAVRKRLDCCMKPDSKMLKLLVMLLSSLRSLQITRNSTHIGHSRHLTSCSLVVAKQAG